jgi:hypothetical protein
MRATVSIAAGAILILGILWDAFETTVLSRRVSHGTRLTTLFYRLTWPTWRMVAGRIRSSRTRENFLTVFGPLSLLLLIALWAVGLVLAFGLLHWGAETQIKAPEGYAGLPADIYLSGTTLFTLGIGDVTPTTSAGRAITVLESGIGLGFLALMISYLPVLSQAFSKREVSIALLDARAGSPPTGSELLRRQGRSRETEALEPLLRDWERASAELLESHVSFPVLAYYRSQHDNQSWVAAMTAILDACALVIAVVENGPVRQARLTFAMARHAAVDMCRVFDLLPLTPRPDRLPAADLARLRESLRQSEIALQPPEHSERRLNELRAMYEPQVHALSKKLLMPLPPWVPPAAVYENWQATAPER